MIETRAFNQEVLYTTADITTVSPADIARFKDMAARNPRRRIRLCAHPNPDQAVHEMLIIHYSDVYVPPHKHLDKSESFHVIEGLGHVFVFDDEGGVIETVRLGEFGSGERFYYRITKSFYHSLVIASDCLVFHETTRGPFDPAETVLAPWAPADNDSPAVAAFMAKLRSLAENQG
ncbi:MAG: WbuC family cupin fold metalloprotein [Deltaproteobacteria bacterium]|nr:WbuC family cupin fold metalloprotein [Deltaproteobacteria bacterium]